MRWDESGKSTPGGVLNYLPHGIYPTKMIGNEFLKVVDLSAQLKSSVLVRFMDDFTLFDDDPDVLRQDFLRIQQLLGQFGLNVNPSKTYYNKSIGDVEETLSALHESLMERTRFIRYMAHHICKLCLLRMKWRQTSPRTKLMPCLAF